MKLREKIENHPIGFATIVAFAAFTAGLTVGRYYLTEQVAIAKIELHYENVRLKETIKESESRLTKLLEAQQDCEKRLAETSSQLETLRNHRKSETEKKKKTASDIQDRAKSRTKLSELTRAGQIQKGFTRNEVSSDTAVLRAQIDSLIFETTRCTMQGRIICLELRITNSSGSEEHLILTASGPNSAGGYYVPADAAPTYLQTARGIKYVANAVEFGNQTAREQVEQRLLPGTSLSARFWFENIQIDDDRINIQLAATRRSLLLLKSSFYVSLPDIPVEVLP